MVNNLIFILNGISVLIAILLIHVSVTRSSKDKTIYFTCFITHVLIYIIGVTLEISAKGFDQALAGTVIQYLGVPFVAPFFLLFIKEYINKPIKNKLIIKSLFIIPFISFLFVFTYDMNGIFYKSFELVVDDQINYVKIEGSVIYFLTFLYINLIYFYALYSVIKVYINSNEIIRKKYNFLLIAAPQPLLITALYVLGLIPYGVHITPLLITEVCIFIGYNIFVKNMFFSVPYARYNVLRSMQEGYILFDSNNNYLDSNSAAAVIFPNLKNAEEGASLINYIDKDKLETLKAGKADNIIFHIFDESGRSKYYKITTSNLTQKNKLKVYCCLMYDITASKEMLNDLEYLAKYDKLTGVFKRTAFFIRANELFNEYRKKNYENFGVIMLDIDLFKNVNDTYGHLCGDYTLNEVAYRLKNVLKKEELIARFGGEEFIVFLENVDINHLENICEKLRKSIEEERFIYNKQEFNVTISLGGVIYNSEKYSRLEELIDSADRLLYEAKNTGRNKFIVY